MLTQTLYIVNDNTRIISPHLKVINYEDFEAIEIGLVLGRPNALR